MLSTALSVNLSMVTLAQGETVKRLGAWAALLAAPTLITSWYGMNFTNMPELHIPYAYPPLPPASPYCASCSTDSLNASIGSETNHRKNTLAIPPSINITPNR